MVDNTRFGGHNSFECFSDVWAYLPKTKNWLKVECTGTAPSPRTYHSAAVVGSTMFIFGGKNSDGVTLSDLFAFDLRSKFVRAQA
jgi:N-acetylneuraminic acid mutarotase